MMKIKIFISQLFCLLIFAVGIDTSPPNSNNESITDELSFEKLEWWQRNIDKRGELNPSAETRYHREFDPSECSLSPELKEEIQGYKATIEQIIEAITMGSHKGKTFEELAYYVDTFGPRVSGSEALENSLTFLENRMLESELSNVHAEAATVPKWIRGEEKAFLLSPRVKELQIKGLGFSVPTPEEGITAEVIVVESFRDMSKKLELIDGKIVIFNSRRESGLHALIGASLAAKYGGVAALVRSATSFSLYSPHTGIQFYDENYPKIPVAALTLEDGDMITRMAARGDKILINLKMENKENGESESRNIIGDMLGREKPEEIVLISGHADSWDVGQGAIDDGIGPILALGVINLLKSMGLQPRRTLRNIAWTGEEAGLVGVRQWMRENRGDLDNYSAAMEADYGCLTAHGLFFSGSSEVGCILHEILTLLAPTNATNLVDTNGLYTDIYGLVLAGVPGIVLDGDDGRYFWYHHTDADTMTALNPTNLDLCLAVWASTSYVIADLKEKLPR